LRNIAERDDANKRTIVRDDGSARYTVLCKKRRELGHGPTRPGSEYLRGHEILSCRERHEQRGG